MSLPIELTKEGLLEFFNRAYAGFAGKDGDYTDVLIDGTYDLEELARAIMAARLQEREEILALLAREAPHSPRRYIYDIKPDRRIWACDQLEANIRARK